VSELVIIPKEELQKLIYSIVTNALEEVENRKKTKDKMNINQAAEYLGISVSTVNRKKDEGEIPFSKIGGRVVYSKKELDKWNEKNKSTAT
jgi:excisionase family DNA binding protein